VAESSDLPEPLRAAVLPELPRALAEAAGAASAFEAPQGRFRVEVQDMDGTPPDEGILVLQEAGKAARVVFVAAAGGKVFRKPVKLPAGEPDEVTLSFPRFAEGRALAQVQGGPAGVALFCWDGRRGDVVWSSGKPRGGERRWFELDDLDEDGIREIVTYQKLLVDVVPDDEMGEEASGSTLEEAGPIEVLRWDGSRWRKDEGLLEALH
jgi:hypothetical protein